MSIKHVSILITVILSFNFAFAKDLSQSCPSIERSLFLGSKGSDVLHLNQFLKDFGFLQSEQYVVTEKYDSNTQSAIKIFQQRNLGMREGKRLLPGYGIVGPKTRDAIKKYCTTNTAHECAGVKQCHIQVSLHTNGCQWNGKDIAHGEYVTAYKYKYSQGERGCISEKRSCTSGNLSGSYAQASCAVILPGSVTVRDFGAKGDGIQDDTVFFQDAIDSGASEIKIPAGTYLIRSLVLKKSVKVLLGDTGAKVVHIGDGPVLSVNGLESVLIHDIEFGVKNNKARDLIEIVNSNRVTIRKVTFTNSLKNALRIKDSSSIIIEDSSFYNNQSSFLCINSSNIFFQKNLITHDGENTYAKGIVLDSSKGVQRIFCKDIHIKQNTIIGSASLIAIEILAGTNIKIDRNVFNDNRAGIKIYTDNLVDIISDIQVSANTFFTKKVKDDSESSAITLLGDSYNQISRVLIEGNEINGTYTRTLSDNYGAIQMGNVDIIEIRSNEIKNIESVGIIVFDKTRDLFIHSNNLDSIKMQNNKSIGIWVKAQSDGKIERNRVNAAQQCVFIEGPHSIKSVFNSC